MCPNTEFFWSLFSSNTGKYGPEKTLYLDNFHAVMHITRNSNNLKGINVKHNFFKN